tara:strand:+ start:28 stop:297 length:270 start_codon:yes stop_codon:yes gene_type:complete
MTEAQKLISKKLKAIHLMCDHCIPDELSVCDIEEIKNRHSLLRKQVAFWEAQGNEIRVIYDLQEFGDWLFNFLGLQDIWDNIDNLDEDF